MDAEIGLYDVKVDAADPDGGFTNSTELGEFNVTGDTSLLEGSWIEKASTPKAGGFGEAVVGTGESIYIIRGYSWGKCQFWEYNTSTNTWDTIMEWDPNGTIPNDPIPRPKSGTAMAYDYDDHIYVLLGAAQSDTGRRYFFRYNISTNTWTQRADTPYDQGAGDSATWSGYDNKLYALIGSTSHGSGFARYDPSSNTWETLDLDWPSIDDGASLSWVGGEYIYGLRGEWEETTPHNDTARYDINTDDWETVASIPAIEGVGDGASLLWIGNWIDDYSGYIFALSGNDVEENPNYGFYCYSISGNYWWELDPLPYSVGNYTGCRLGLADFGIYYWQGQPSTCEGGGNFFAKFEP